MTFLLFLQYISFTNNICKVNSEERLELIKKFNSFDFGGQVFKEKIEEGTSKNVTQFPFSELVKSYNIILSWYFNQEYVHERHEEKTNISSVILFDIVEHLFFLNLIPTNTLLSQLNNIYQFPFFTPSDKL